MTFTEGGTGSIWAGWRLLRGIPVSLACLLLLFALPTCPTSAWAQQSFTHLGDASLMDHVPSMTMLPCESPYSIRSTLRNVRVFVLGMCFGRENSICSTGMYCNPFSTVAGAAASDGQAHGQFCTCAGAHAF